MTKKIRHGAARALLCVVAMVVAGCAGMTTRPTSAGQATPAWDDAQQMIVVTTADWDANTGTLQRFERDGGHWRPLGEAAPITVGRSGSAWGVGVHPAQAGEPQKREGDGRAPAGVFRIGTAFGYADSTASGWPYQAMTASDYCIDVNGSPLYNRIVNAGQVGANAVAGSTEPMRRDLHAGGDQRYKLGFVIEHNPDNQSGAGSCIFAHLWKASGEATAGCTAMAEPEMRQLLAWLDPKRKPVFVLLPKAEYSRVQQAWGLPTL